MVSLVVAIGKSQQKREALLQDIAQQDFPAQALQVVLVSNRADAFKNLPEVNYDLRTVMIKDKKYMSAMVDVAIRQCSGDFIYVLDEETIFDNPNDLLKLYGFLLDHPGVDVCAGYNIEHHIYEPKKASARVMKSTVLEMNGHTNICFRRRVIESGFSFHRYLFADNAIGEIQSMGFTVDKLKWLQVHHKKSVPFFMVGVLHSQEWLLALWQKVYQVSALQRLQQQLLRIYHSERIHKLSIQLRWWAQDLMVLVFKYSRLGWQLGKVYFLRLKVYSAFTRRRLTAALRHRWDLQKKISNKKIYVPHLESRDDAPQVSQPKSPPLFKLKSSERSGESEL